MHNRLRRPLWAVALAMAMLATAACSKDETPEAPAPAATAAAPATAATAAAPAPTAASTQAVFSREELDQMFAPIALYPDKLIAQVLMAATYPGNVADAAAWSKAHPSAKGDSAVALVADQPWDPSVQSLVAFPQVLATLGQDPGWVQRMGDAFLAQPEAVMDSVQRLRRQAQQAGNLASNEYQKVSTQAPPPEVLAAAQAVPADVAGVAPAPPEPVIIIESAQPDTVYVPSYDPTTVYGSWPYPAYPPTYYPPPAAYYPLGGAMLRGIAWGTGLAIADSLWGDSDWWGGDVDIDVNRYNNINVNRQINAGDNTWRHDPARRDGVPYRDQANRDRYGRQLDGAAERAQFRGEDANRTRQREQARASMERRGVDAPARTNAEAQARAREVARSPEARAALEGRDARGAGAPTRGGDRAAAADRARAQAAAGERRDAAGARSQAQARQSQQRARQAQGNTQARDAARQRHHAQGGGRDNAFRGASQPRTAQAQAQRGRSSHAAAQRPQSARGGGQPVQRQAQAPRQHQASRGGSRSAPAGGGGRRR